MFNYLIKIEYEGTNFVGWQSQKNGKSIQDAVEKALRKVLKTKIKNWESRPDLQNRSQAHAPEHTYSIGTNIDLKNNFYFKLNLNGKSEFFYSDSHNNKSKSYQLLNLTFGRSKGRFTSELWMRNVFDKYYSTRGFYFGNEAPDFIDTLYRRQGDPKNIGLSLRYDF